MRKGWLCFLFCAAVSLAASGLERQSPADYHVRREKLAAKLEGGVALVFAPPEAEGPNDLYGYRPDDSFYYLTGWPEPGAALLIAASREAKDDTLAPPYTEILFLPNRNFSQEQWTGPKLGPDNSAAAQLTGVDRVESIDNMRSELVRLVPIRSAIYTDVPGAGDTSNSTMPLAWLQNANAFPVGTSYRDIRPLLGSLRTVKDAGEIDRLVIDQNQIDFRMRDAAGFNYVLDRGSLGQIPLDNFVTAPAL